MKSVGFRIPAAKLNEIDELAGAQDRGRSFLLNEAVDHYLDVQEYHIGLISQGIREAEAGELIPHDEVGRRLQERRQEK